MKRMEDHNGEMSMTWLRRTLRWSSQVDWRRVKKALQNLTRRLSKTTSRMDEKEQQIIRMLRRKMK